MTARTIWRHVRGRRSSLALLCFRSSGLSMKDWVRYLRRQRRTGLIGTPLAADGEFLDPMWLAVADTPPRETVAQ
jgi:hypothetical protein